MKSRAHIFVSGIVQGVYFRDFTRSHATALSLTGWVRNLPDGRVEAVAEGEHEDIHHLIKRMKSGSPGSRVENVEVTWENPTDSFTGFQITYW